MFLSGTVAPHTHSGADVGFSVGVPDPSGEGVVNM